MTTLPNAKDAEVFANREAWKDATRAALERRAFRIGTLRNAGTLTQTHLLHYLNYARRYTNDTPFASVYHQLKESVGDAFTTFFEQIDENAKSEIFLP